MRDNYQYRVNKWILECFGAQETSNTLERSHRFAEEVFELLQSASCPKNDILEILDYVYNREVGDKKQEVGGVILTLSALCNALEINMLTAGEDELERVWRKIDSIRQKRLGKRLGSPLP